MLQAVQLYQMAFVSVNRAGVLPNITDVIDAAWQGVEITVFDGLQSGNAQFGDARDLLQGDPFRLTNVSYPPLLKGRSCRSTLRSAAEAAACRAADVLRLFGSLVLRFCLLVIRRNLATGGDGPLMFAMVGGKVGQKVQLFLV